jgi:hypothetical protein
MKTSRHNSSGDDEERAEDNNKAAIFRGAGGFSKREQVIGGGDYRETAANFGVMPVQCSRNRTGATAIVSSSVANGSMLKGRGSG